MFSNRNSGISSNGNAPKRQYAGQTSAVSVLPKSAMVSTTKQ